jgi:hypothetical protein
VRDDGQEVIRQSMGSGPVADVRIFVLLCYPMQKTIEIAISRPSQNDLAMPIPSQDIVK